MFADYNGGLIHDFLKKTLKNYFESCLALEKSAFVKDKERMRNLRNEIDDIIEKQVIPEHQRLVDGHLAWGVSLNIEYEVNNGFTIYTVENFPLCPYQATFMAGKKFQDNIFEKLGVEVPYGSLVRFRSPEAILQEVKQIFTDYATMNEHEFVDKYCYTVYLKGASVFNTRLVNGVLSNEFHLNRKKNDLLDGVSGCTHSVGELDNIDIKNEVLQIITKNTGAKSSVKNGKVWVLDRQWYDVIDCDVTFYREDNREYYIANEVEITIRNTENNTCLMFRTLIDRENGIKLGEYYTDNVYESPFPEQKMKEMLKRESVIKNIESYKVKLKRQAETREM